MQSRRESFVATPTAELSKQEETLLGDILDWSLDTSCSGYEGDQDEDSEGEKDVDGKCQQESGWKGEYEWLSYSSFWILSEMTQHCYISSMLKEKQHFVFGSCKLAVTGE